MTSTIDKLRLGKKDSKNEIRYDRRDITTDDLEMKEYTKSY
jgi:hypothetical protein